MTYLFITFNIYFILCIRIKININNLNSIYKNSLTINKSDCNYVILYHREPFLNLQHSTRFVILLPTIKIY